MKIGYAKPGRSMPLTLAGCGTVGGDNEPLSVLLELARRHPADEFFVLGRNSGEAPLDAGLPSNVYNPWCSWAPEYKKMIKRTVGTMDVQDQLRVRDWHEQVTRPAFRNMDAIVMWLGQLGTTNSPIPSVEFDGLTKPQAFSMHYASFVLHGINAWRDHNPWEREEVHLNADPRNVYKSRDLKWPLRHPCLAQFNSTYETKHERYEHNTPGEEYAYWANNYGVRRKGKLWIAPRRDVYSRLEICGIAPGTPVGDLVSFNGNWYGRSRFGLFINEARAYVNPRLSRLEALKRWVLPLEPAFVHGTWSAKSLNELGLTIEPAPWERYYPLLHSVLATLTTPSSGSGWATTKPWEAFAAGTVCFFHPDYDTQNHILGDAPQELRDFLRVVLPSQLQQRVAQLTLDRGLWERMVALQRAHFDAAIARLDYLRAIEARIWK